MSQLLVKMKFGEDEIWVPCYLDGGSAIIFDLQQFEKDVQTRTLLNQSEQRSIKRQASG